MDLARLRNLGVAAHIDAGKTTVTERILNATGVEHRVGRVDEGTAVMDWMAEERERGITITAAATRVEWQGHQLNLIDTPGHVDFTLEVERCMRVLDGTILVIDAVAGVQAQSETVWRQMQRHRIPAVVFVNKADKIGADVAAAAQSVTRRLGVDARLVQYPWYEEQHLVGVVDVLRRKAWRFDDAGGATEGAVPAELADETGVLRAELVDDLADEDEGLMTAVLEDREPSDAELVAALRRRCLERSILPVLCGAALRGVGIQPLLDAVVDYLPSPLDRPPVVGHEPQTGATLPPRPPDPAGSATALVFKLHSGPHGDLTFVRIYAGTIQPGRKLWNPRTRRMERPGQVRRVHADGGQALDEASAGDIVALTGLKHSVTGDTLCDRAEPIALEALEFPEPVIALVLEPQSGGDRDRLRLALERLAHEDPSFRVQENEETGQWSIEGMGELHLEVQLHRLSHEFGLEVQVGKPRVSYREAVHATSRGEATVDRVQAGEPIFASFVIEVRPGAGEGPPVIEWGPDVTCPGPFRPAVEEALRQEAGSGPRFGFPLVGGVVRILGDASREGAESETAFVQAAAMALRSALQPARMRILEPRMAFEIESPEEFASGILADLNARRAEVGEVVAEGPQRVLRGTVALAAMFGYSTAVRSLSQGRAGFSLTPAGYTPVPEAELEDRGLLFG